MGGLRRSQTDLQFAEQNIHKACVSISEFIDNPLSDEAATCTLETLHETLQGAEGAQLQLIEQAVVLAEQMSTLYTTSERPLGRKAAHCMKVYEAFMDVIDPFVDPFKYTQAQLLQKTNAHQQNFAKFANLLNSDIVQIDSQPKSWYFHFLAFHAQHCQLSSIHECGRPLASFKAEYVEASNKVKKEEAISLHAFTHRPVGSLKGDKQAPAKQVGVSDPKVQDWAALLFFVSWKAKTALSLWEVWLRWT